MRVTLVDYGVGNIDSLATACTAVGAEVFVAAAAHGRPVLGTCLGMRLLFDESAEGEGRGLIPGGVRRLSGARTPQTGWNTIDDTTDQLLDQSALQHMYYADSFVCQPDDPTAVIAWSVFREVAA